MEQRNNDRSLIIRLLGPFDARLNGAPLPPLRTRKGQWLLALLILKRDRPVDRDWVAGTLWPDSTQELALVSLRKSLNDLRHALGSEASRLYAPTPRTLAIDLTDVFVDLVAFDVAVAYGDERSLEQAITLYHGPLLENCLEEWALLERETREQSYVRALEALAQNALLHDDPAVAIDRLRLCITVNPLRETAYRALMQAYAAHRDYAAVTQVYRNLRLYLRQELNADPDPETTEIYQQLRMDAQNRAVRADEKRKADNSKPGIRPASRIPHPITELIGRENEIREIEEILASAPLVTLLGTGGVGKTRLAIEVAKEMREEFADGVWFVDLAALSDPQFVPHTVATTLGLREAPGCALTETLTENLREKSLLLVLDNCEHLLEACAHLAHTLIEQCPHLRLLGTSRKALGITGEVVWRAPSLSVPKLTKLPLRKDAVVSLLEYDAVRLFISRALLSHPSFRLTPQNAQVVVQICRRLDGVPLAIELAAARTKVLTVEQIVERLDDRFRLLTGGSRTTLPRQQTLRAAMDWSYGLLTEAERTLLNRLSVFAGGWTLDAAEAVCGDFQLAISNFQLQPTSSQIENGKWKMENYEVLDLLTSLIDQSLVMVGVEEGGERRYTLLETVRQYSSDRLREAGSEATLRDRHADYYLALAEEARKHLGGVGQAQWLERIEADHENLRTALAYTMGEQKPSPEKALRLAVSLFRFWFLRGYLSEGRELLAGVLSREETASWPILRAQALRGVGTLAGAQGDFTAACAYFEESLSICQAHEDRPGIAETLDSLGASAEERGDHTVARRRYEEAQTIWRELGERHSLARSLNNLANVEQNEGDYAAAHAHYAECLAIFREFDDKVGIGAVLNNQGNTAYNQGHHEEARRYYEESLRIRQELGHRIGIANTLSHLGNLASEQRDYGTAQRLLEESLTILHELGDHPRLAYGLHNMGCIVFRQGAYETARIWHRKSLTIMLQVMDRYGLAFLLESFAGIAFAQNRMERAARLWGGAEALREAIGSPRPLHQREEYDRQVTSLKTTLGEEAFAAIWSEGRAMSLEQAVEYASQDDEA